MRQEKQRRNWAWLYYVSLSLAVWAFAWPPTAQADTVTLTAQIDDPSRGYVSIRVGGGEPVIGTSVTVTVQAGSYVSVGTPNTTQMRYWTGLPLQGPYSFSVDPYSYSNTWLVNTCEDSPPCTWRFKHFVLVTAPPEGEDSDPEVENDRDPMSCQSQPVVNAPTGASEKGDGLGSWGLQDLLHSGKQKEREGAESDPVLLHSGEFAQDSVDLRIPGRGLDFVWGRSYRSKKDQSSTLGNQWDHTYNIYAESEPDSAYRVHFGNGRSDAFTLNANRGAYYAQGWSTELSLLPNEDLCLTFGEGIRWQFHGFGIPEVGKRGKLYSITDRYGNSLSLAYNTDGKLLSVTDTLGRDILFSYYPGGHPAAGLLQYVTDFAGRQITYEYYGENDPDGGLGDLRKVSYPPITGTPTLNNFPEGRSLLYTYSTGQTWEKLNHNLLTVRDGRGQVYLRNTYSSPVLGPLSLQFDRVTEQQWGQGMVSFCYDFGVNPTSANHFAVKRTIVKDRVGNVTEYFFDWQNNTVMKDEYTGRANPSLPTTVTGNRPGVRLRSTDPYYFRTQYVWSSSDYLTSRTDPNGNVTYFIYQSSYDPDGDPRTRDLLRKILFTPGSHTPAGDQQIIAQEIEYAPGFAGCGCGLEFVSLLTDGEGNSTSYSYDDSGNLTRIDYPKLDVYETFEYNAYGQPTAHVHPDNGSGHRRRDAYTYYTSGPQNGYLQSAVVDATGEALTTVYEYDAVGNITRITDPKGGDVQYVYNSNDDLIRSISPIVGNGLALRYTRDYIYDANANLVRADERNYDADGQEGPPITTALEYDLLNRVTRALKSAETQYDTENRFAYDLNGNLTQIKTGEAVRGTQPSNLIDLSYDERDKLYQAKRSLNFTTQFDYDGNGNLVKRLVGLEGTERVDTFVYDGYDRLVNHTDPVGTVAGMTYDANGQMLNLITTGRLGDGSTTAARLGEASYGYDTLGRLIGLHRQHFNPATQVPLGDGSSDAVLAYAGDGNLLQVTNDNGRTITFAYDTAGRLSEATDARGNSIEYGYDDNSNIVNALGRAVSDIDGLHSYYTSTYAYDNLDRLVGTTDGAGNAAQYAYDSRGNRVRFTDPLGNVTERVFDGISRLLDEVRHLPGGGTMTLHQTWDANSRLRTQTDARGNTTSYDYSVRDHLSRVTYADNTDEEIWRDIFGDPFSITDANGTVVADTHDALGRLTARSITPAGGVGGGGSETFRYDGLSRLTYASDSDSVASFAFDSLGNPLQESLQAGAQPQRDTLYTYDGSGLLQSVTYPGGRVLDYQYDALGRISTIADRGAAALAAYGYDGGHIARLDYANGTRLDLSYDGQNPYLKERSNYLTLENDFGFGRPIQTLHSRVADGSVIDQRTYTWDRLQNKTQRSDLRPSSLQAASAYSYDTLSRLTQSIKTFPQGRQITQTYALDPAGNRDSVTAAMGVLWDYELGTGSGSAMNQYAETPLDVRSYDANGNLTSKTISSTVNRTATFDAYNQLVQHAVSNPDGAPQLSLLDVTGADLDGWFSQSGTWSMAGGSLSGTGTAARIVRPVPVPYDRFVFSYRTAHDPANPAIYDPEYYAMAVLRVDPASTAWRYVALAIEPNGIFLREWIDDQPTELAANPSATTSANVWYDVEVRFSGANIEVWRGERGQAKTLILTGSTGTGLSSNLVGLGAGAGTDYRFDDVGLTAAGSRVAGTASYAYDALGRRISKTVDGTTTYYGYTGNRVVEERAADGTLEATYVYGSYIDEVLQMRRGGQDYYYHADDQYNVVALTDATGNAVERYDYGDFGYPEFYAPDGTPRSGSSVGNPWLFTGRQWDPELGCYYYRSRYMDPLAGTFLSRDPIGLWGDPGNLGNGNTYCGNNPWSMLDPFGLQADPVNDNQAYRAQLYGNSSPTADRNSTFDQSADFVHQIPLQIVEGGAAGVNGATGVPILPAADNAFTRYMNQTGQWIGGIFGVWGGLSSADDVVRGVGAGVEEAANVVKPVEGRLSRLCKWIRGGADEVPSAELKPYGGPGGGHHVPAQSAFRGAEGYNPNDALAIANAELERLGVSHRNITRAQQSSYRAFADSGRTLSWDDVQEIEIDALIQGGMNSEQAVSTVQEALLSLQHAGVSGPTRIPWGGN